MPQKPHSEGTYGPLVNLDKQPYEKYNNVNILLPAGWEMLADGVFNSAGKQRCDFIFLRSQRGQRRKKREKNA